MSNQSHTAKKSRVVIGTLSNGHGATIEVTASAKGKGNAAVQQREALIRNVREGMHSLAAHAHAVFHPGQAPPQALKKRKHYPKPKAHQGGKQTRKMRKMRKGMTRRRR